jgi:hypothetical protein
MKVSCNAKNFLPHPVAVARRAFENKKAGIAPAFFLMA